MGKYTVGEPESRPLDSVGSVVKRIRRNKIYSNQGPIWLEFSKKLAVFTGFEFCVPIANATLGLAICPRLFGTSLPWNVSSFTFRATYSGLDFGGAVKIQPLDINCDFTTDLSSTLGSRNNLCLVDAYGKNSLSHGVIKNNFLLVDASHSLCRNMLNKNRSLEKCDLAVVSLHATKIVGTLEGGLLLTNDRKIYDEILKSTTLSASSKLTPFGGVNCKLDELRCGIGIKALEVIDDLISRRANLGQVYNSELKYGETLERSTGCESNYGYFPFFLPEDLLPFRQIIVEEMGKKNIGCRAYFDDANCLCGQNARNLSQSVICLPIHSRISQAEGRQIAAELNKLCESFLN